MFHKTTVRDSLIKALGNLMEADIGYNCKELQDLRGEYELFVNDAINEAVDNEIHSYDTSYVNVDGIYRSTYKVDCYISEVNSITEALGHAGKIYDDTEFRDIAHGADLAALSEICPYDVIGIDRVWEVARDINNANYAMGDVVS